MQLHHVDLVPGESVRVGNLLVTLVEVQGSTVQLHVHDDDDSDYFSDPFDDASLQPELISAAD
jgi:hypothetical protein